MTIFCWYFSAHSPLLHTSPHARFFRRYFASKQIYARYFGDMTRIFPKFPSHRWIIGTQYCVRHHIRYINNISPIKTEILILTLFFYLLPRPSFTYYLSQNWMCFFFKFIIFIFLNFFIRQTPNGVWLNAFDFLIIFASSLELKIENKLI